MNVYIANKAHAQQIIEKTMKNIDETTDDLDAIRRIQSRLLIIVTPDLKVGEWKRGYQTHPIVIEWLKSQEEVVNIRLRRFCDILTAAQDYEQHATSGFNLKTLMEIAQ